MTGFGQITELLGLVSAYWTVITTDSPKRIERPASSLSRPVLFAYRYDTENTTRSAASKY